MDTRLPAAALLAVALLAVATPGFAKKRTVKSEASPVPSATGAAPSGAMAYYLMQGSRIVSQSYPDVGACYKALAALQHGMDPGTDSVVCVHRRP